MKCHKVGGLNNRNLIFFLFSHSSGVKKSKIKATDGLTPSEGYEGL